MFLSCANVCSEPTCKYFAMTACIMCHLRLSPAQLQHAQARGNEREVRHPVQERSLKLQLHQQTAKSISKSFLWHCIFEILQAFNAKVNVNGMAKRGTITFNISFIPFYILCYLYIESTLYNVYMRMSLSCLQ